MAQVNRPGTPQSQHASTTTPLLSGPSSQSPVSPSDPASPLTALPQLAAGGNASAKSSPPLVSTSANAQRPAAASPRRTSEKTFQIIRTFASPSTHEAVDNSPLPVPPTVRDYDRTTQRWRLWNLVWLEWMITGILCVALWGLLFGYSRHHIEVDGGLSVRQKRIFNALATGLSIALGLNLAGSLRSYIKILRWRLLATRYRSLTEFELVLGLERQASLFKLIWKSRNKRHCFLPSATQLLCILWIAINLAAAVLVAMLGLTYNIDQSANYVSTQSGAVSVVDFNLLVQGGFINGLPFVQNLGDVGSNFDIESSLDYKSGGSGTYENVGDTSRYWFDDYNVNDTNLAVQSYRYVDGIAACSEYPIVEGVFGNQSSITYQQGSHNIKHNLPAAGRPGPGGLVFISDTAKTCGDRCTTTKVLQAQADPEQLELESGVTEAKFFICNTTVSQVYNIPSESYNAYVMSDQIARMFAGAIGWSGEQIPGDSEEYVVYSVTNGLTNTIFSNANADQIAGVLSRYSIGAVAAMDNIETGDKLRQIIQGEEPGYANYLQVVWWHAGPLLIGIPCLQLASLIAVIAIGNRAVIKDDSYLAVAELYRNTINRLGEHGSMLRGAEIIDALKDPANGEEPRVIYAWKDGGNDANGWLKHIDVFDDKSGFEPQPAFVPGRYD